MWCRWGFDLIVWINKKNMKRKFLGLLACFQHWGRLKGKWCALQSFSRGLASVSMKISCLAHLSEEREALALTPDPSKAACIAARHSHAIGGKGGSMPGGWIREHWNSVVGLTSFSWSLQATCGVIFLFFRFFLKLIITSWFSGCKAALVFSL